MDRTAHETTQGGNRAGDIRGVKGPDAKVAPKDRTTSPGKLPKDPQAPHGDPGDGAD